MKRPRYRVVTYHGEHGTIYNAVDTAQPDAEQPAVVLSFATPGEPNAAYLVRDFCERHNAKEDPTT